MENPASSQLPADASADMNQITQDAPLFVHSRSLTRLVVGGIGLFMDELWSRLEEWETTTDRQVREMLPAAQQDGISPARKGAVGVRESGSAVVTARRAMIGMIFQAEDNIRYSVAQAGRIGRLIEKSVSPLLKPLARLPLIKPAKRRYDQLVARGEMELASWIKTGEEQELSSRILMTRALSETIDAFFDYLAANPSVRDLVQTQSTGLANEVVEEVRERTVSADTFLEGIARGIFRKTPRVEVPAPSPEVKIKAASLRSIHQRGKKRLQ